MDDPTIRWTLDRLTELRADYATGNAQLVELARRQHDVRASVLRIEGAIRVLEEQIAQSSLPAARADAAEPSS